LISTLTFKGRSIVPGRVRGAALVSTKPISFLGGVDVNTGTIIERDHDLYGKSIKDSVLCFPHGRGSTVGSFVLYRLAKNGLAPKAIINSIADPVVVVGAIIANIPMVDKINIEMIANGDIVEVDGETGIVRVFRSG
jgi:predicted aconitase with swiveling domain